MRLIDAHKLWDVMNKAILHHIVTNTLWNTLKSVIENAPTIDAVEVVRCKNCYYAEDDITHMFCIYFHSKVYEDDYCSNAVERRGESEVEE